MFNPGRPVTFADLATIFLAYQAIRLVVGFILLKRTEDRQRKRARDIMRSINNR